MFTKDIFTNYDVDITIHNDTEIRLSTDNDIEEIIHNLIELFEDNTENNQIDNIIQQHLKDVLFYINFYSTAKRMI